MAKLRANIERAAALHRDADLIVTAAEQALERRAAQPVPAGNYSDQHELAATLRAAASQLAPGWLGDPLDVVPPSTPLPTPGQPRVAGTEPSRYIRVGTAQPLDDATFPAIVPLANHLTIDGDVRDARVAGLLRSLTLRLVAAHPAGAIRIRTVDATGAAFGAFHDLVPVGLMSAPVADRDGLRGVLTEVEEWVREPGQRHSLVLMIASFPQFTDQAEFARIVQLADLGPSRGLHLVVAGWPPPSLTGPPHPPAGPPPPTAAPRTTSEPPPPAGTPSPGPADQTVYVRRANSATATDILPDGAATGTPPPHQAATSTPPPHSTATGTPPPHSTATGTPPPHSTATGTPPVHSRRPAPATRRRDHAAQPMGHPRQPPERLIRHASAA